MMRSELMISFRYFRSRKKSFISFMSTISILGIAVGVAALITVLAVMSGFGAELQRRIIGSNPHIIIEKETGIDDYGYLMKEADAIEGVKGAYPFIWGQAVLQFRTRAHGAVIRSMDETNSTDLSKLAGFIRQGELDLKDNSIIIGNELASTLGVFLGDEISIVTPSSKKPRTFVIKAVFSSGMYEYDLNLAYVSLESSASIFGMGSYVNGIGIDIDDIEAARDIQAHLRSVLPGSYYVRTWMDMNSNLFAALRLEKFAMFVILTLIVIVAALNMISTLTVMVTEKTKDIGILKAIGATSTSIMAIFSMQGMMIGFCGVLFGAIGGIGLSLLLKYYHLNILPESIYYGINYLPVKIDIADSSIIVISALLISLLGSLYPAYQAAHLHPADALKYE